MKHVIWLGLAALWIICPGEGEADTQTPLIVIDRWWGVDYAKAGCIENSQIKPRCAEEQTRAYNTFLLTYFPQPFRHDT